MDLTAWLESVGLARLKPQLVAAGIDLDVLRDLESADLETIGLNLGDRKRLLKAIAMSSPSTEGGNSSDGPVAVRADPPFPVTAERRQLSVMFCDLVGSTILSSRLDPEDLRQVISAYHQAVSAAVAAFDGFVAQFLGDGVLVYFGYPMAHEDDADRCVHAGLSVVTAVSQLRPRGELQLQTRIGIASGEVVVGAIGVGTPAAEMSASGETPSLAARLQGCAQPGEVIISNDTRRLVGKSFELKALGALHLKGFDAPVLAWQVMGERLAASRFEAHHSTELTQFVGRDSEASMLQERWAMACEREGQVALLSGEAGIGKSRICQVLFDRLDPVASTSVVWQCTPYGTSSALHPVARHLERFAGFIATDPPAARSLKLERTLVDLGLASQATGLFQRLAGLPDEGRIPKDLTAQQVKGKSMAAIVELLQRLADRRPTLLLVEDAHWIDPTTEELLGMAIDRLRGARVLILVTSRPEYVPSWGNSSNLTRIVLGRLGQRQCAALIASVAGGRQLPSEVLSEIVKKTDGIPLFVEELTKTVIESNLMRETEGGFELIGALSGFAIPSTLQDSLMARLDRVAPAKEVAQVGSTIGREFSLRLLTAVLERMPEVRMTEALGDLVKSELVFRSGTSQEIVYTFKHALVRDAAYGSMVKSQRAMWHGQIASALQRNQPETVVAQPELLAFHFQEAGNYSEAFQHWRLAGDLAVSRTAIREGVKHYQCALALIDRQVPPLGGTDEECGLQMKLGTALMNSEGYGSPLTRECFARALELSSGTVNVDHRLTVCAGIAPTLYAAGRFSDVVQMYEQVPSDDLSRARIVNRIGSHACLGIARYHLGQYDQAWDQLQLAVGLDEGNPDAREPALGGAISGIPVRTYASRVRAYSGYPADGLRLALDALDIAEQSGHVPSRVWALAMMPLHLTLKGDLNGTIRYANEALAIAERLGMTVRVGLAVFALGRVNVINGNTELGLKQVRQGYATWATSGGRFHTSEYCALLANDLLDAGLVDEAAEFIFMGEQVQRECEERLAEAELIRLQGRLLELSAKNAAAEGEYRRAISVATNQGAMLFSLRAATDLARLLGGSGNGVEGRAILYPIYSWFSDGFEYLDLIRAKAVLTSLP